jgi:hypothetical protein
MRSWKSTQIDEVQQIESVISYIPRHFGIDVFRISLTPVWTYECTLVLGTKYQGPLNTLMHRFVNRDLN